MKKQFIFGSLVIFTPAILPVKEKGTFFQLMRSSSVCSGVKFRRSKSDSLVEI